jgi:DNA primase
VIARSLKVLEHYHLLENAKLLSADIEILCPFHEDTNPSCRVWLENETYSCFACGAKGDLAKLVAALERVNPIEALVRIQQIMRDPESKFDGELIAKIELTRRVKKPELDDKEAVEQAGYYFFSLPQPPWDSTSNHYMLNSRGFTPQTLKRFDVRINGSSEFPIIFPVVENGTFRGTMSRSLDNRKDKYRMSKGMRKTEVLFGRVLPGLPVIVTEGAFDAMKTWQNLRALGMRGYGIASPLNWSASESQLDKLSAASAILAAFDNDRPGEEGCELLRKRLGVRLPVVRLPIPAWIHDMAELEPREFQAGLVRANSLIGR